MSWLMWPVAALWRLISLVMVLTVTGVGAVVGVPLILLGLMLMARGLF